MRDYKQMLRQNADVPELSLVEDDINNADIWQSAYWIGSFLFNQDSGEADRLILKAYEKSFRLGLNVRTDLDCFLKATQQLAIIYFQFRMYEEAINKLMVLTANADQVPDWVHLYYASALIHTENLLRLAEEPKIFFRRIDQIDESNPDSVNKRKFIFLEFLNRISELSETRDVSKTDTDCILDKADELGLENTDECHHFKAALGIADEDITSAIEIPAVYESMIADLNQKLFELQSIIDQQKQELNRSKQQTKNDAKELTNLKRDKQNLERRAEMTAQNLRETKEREALAQNRIKALESQLSGNEKSRQQLEENAAVISELQSDVIDLKATLSEVRKENMRLKELSAADNEHLKKLKRELEQSQAEIQKLNSTIANQKTQIEAAQAAVKEAEEKASAESSDQISNRSDPGAQVSSRPSFKADDFLQRRQKILIIGGSEAKADHLRGKLKSLGFDFSKDQLEFELEYDNVKDYASRIKQYSTKYAGIIVGPCPHKAKDIGGYSSFIEKMKSEKGYPHIEEARDKSGNLKISKTSISDAMKRMAVHLQSIA